MTFEQWWMEYQGSIKWVDEGAPQAKKAWDYQQRLIDEQQKEIAHWRAKCILLQDKIDEYGASRELLAKLNPKEYGDDV